ncbi:MAG: hypothetical protein HZB33_08980 [Nitrospirae bacterium]|nr:hypothetical protein [Nitrospirota bacterium]
MNGTGKNLPGIQIVKRALVLAVLVTIISGAGVSTVHAVEKTFVSSDSFPIAIPDNSVPGVNSTLNVLPGKCTKIMDVKV